MLADTDTSQSDDLTILQTAPYQVVFQRAACRVPRVLSKYHLGRCNSSTFVNPTGNQEYWYRLIPILLMGGNDLSHMFKYDLDAAF